MPKTRKKQQKLLAQSKVNSGSMILQDSQLLKLLLEVVRTLRNGGRWDSSWSITWDSVEGRLRVEGDDSAMKKLAKSQEDSKYWRVNLGAPSSQPTN